MIILFIFIRTNCTCLCLVVSTHFIVPSEVQSNGEYIFFYFTPAARRRRTGRGKYSPSRSFVLERKSTYGMEKRKKKPRNSIGSGSRRFLACPEKFIRVYYVHAYNTTPLSVGSFHTLPNPPPVAVVIRSRHVRLHII